MLNHKISLIKTYLQGDDEDSNQEQINSVPWKEEKLLPQLIKFMETFEGSYTSSHGIVLLDRISVTADGKAFVKAKG